MNQLADQEVSSLSSSGATTSSTAECPPLKSPEFSPSDPDHAAAQREFPLQLETDTQGTDAEPVSTVDIVEGECNRCGYDRLKRVTDTIHDEQTHICNACDATQADTDRGYTFRDQKVAEASADERNGGEIGVLCTRSVYDLTPSKGLAYLSLVAPRERTRLRNRDVAKLFGMLITETAFPSAEIRDALSEETRMAAIEALRSLPE